MLDSLTPIILDHQGTGVMKGVRAPVAYDGAADLTPRSFVLGDYRITARFIDPWAPETHGALVIKTGEEEFLFAGTGVTITFEATGERASAGIETADEGRFDEGRWRPRRRLNGDQTHQGRHIRLPPDGFSVQRATLYRY